MNDASRNAPSPAESESDEKLHGTKAALILGAIGVVFGDIGTSPLYTLAEVFRPEYGLHPSESTVLGVLSLVTWALVSVVAIKYVTLVMRADNRGEGGIMALMTLAQRAIGGSPTARRVVMLMALLGAALFFGDGVITPSPKNSAAPSSAISITTRRAVGEPPMARWASVINAMMPPSPRLSARITNVTYLIATTLTSAQVTSDSTPSTVLSDGCRPYSGRNTSPSVYSGLVPMSPNTTPIAPTISAALLPCSWSAPSAGCPLWFASFMSTRSCTQRGA